MSQKLYTWEAGDRGYGFDTELRMVTIPICFTFCNRAFLVLYAEVHKTLLPGLVRKDYGWFAYTRKI